MALLAATVAVVLCAGASPAGAVKLQVVAQGLAEPVHVTGAPGDDTRLYVVEKAGRIKVARGGTVQPQPFLDVSASISAAGEGGLLSMAFPPDHRATGRFYVVFTVAVTGGWDIVVAERRLSDCSPDVADPAYTREVIRIAHPGASNHFGGQLQWGPDGNLWLSTGDGGGGYDPFENAQNKDSLLGKLLRITPMPGAGGYTVPADNPFVGAAGRDEIWAYGLRNPWRFSFDRQTGDLWIGDVGQGGVRPPDPTIHQNIEEVDVARAAANRLPGANFGWDRFEGDRDFGTGTPAPADHVAPVITHLGGPPLEWSAITGGYVVRDPALEVEGDYVYSDLAHGQIWHADAAAPGTPAATGLAIAPVVSFGEDHSGRVYVVQYGFDNGVVYKLTSDTGTNGPALPASPAGGCVPAGGGGGGGDGGGGGSGGGDGGGGATPTPDVGAPGPGEPALGSLADIRGPLIGSRAPRRQRLSSAAGLLFRASCDEACRVTVRGVLAAGGRRYGLGSAARALGAGQRVSLRVRLGRRARAAARAALRRNRSAVATLTIRATDAAGNASARTARVQVVR